MKTIALTWEEIATLAGWHRRVAREMSVMTGGEPCVREHQARAAELEQILFPNGYPAPRATTGQLT